MLQPLSSEIQKQDEEIEAAQVIASWQEQIMKIVLSIGEPNW